MKNKKGFTLAEVLITLSIIGVIAAILFPSILANYNERTLKAKRQALVGRMSQAMGEMMDQFRNYADVNCDDPGDPTTCTDIGSAAKFVNEGLSKVYKIAAVCDNDSLSACDIPEEITREDGTTFSLKDNGKTMISFNPQIQKNATSFPHDTNSVGIMTKNGESILLWYNPNCQGKSTYNNYYVYAESEYCVNMVYDLNGAKKKPNRIGEDIGYITVFYSDMPYVVAPRPYDFRAVPDYETTTNATGEEVPTTRIDMSQADAQAACAAFGENVGLPSHEEAMAMQINRELWAPWKEQMGRPNGNEGHGTWFWTSTKASPTQAWAAYLIDKNRSDAAGMRFLYTMLSNTSNTEGDGGTRCVYKD